MPNQNTEKTSLKTPQALRHLLGIEGLERDTLLALLDRAETFIDKDRMRLKQSTLLKDRIILNLFFEPSTRTRCSFEIAAKRLAADTLNFNMSLSSLSKGESIVDTVHNLVAMQVDLFVVRHTTEGMPAQVAQAVGPDIAVINAGDGRNEHPTQALLDMMTIRHYKRDFASLKVAIVGDVLNSRVARSEIYALQTLGVHEIRVIAPNILLPDNISEFPVEVTSNIDEGLQDIDVVIILRLQRERMRDEHMPNSQEYYADYGLTQQRLTLAKRDAIVMHPGPINRGVEIESAVADGTESVILQQVTFGVAMRMAVMATLLKQ